MRHRRETLTTIHRPHGPGLVLARRYPGDDDLRALVIEHWSRDSASPRRQIEHSVSLPVSTREQTTLQASLPRAVRDALNGWVQSGAQSRRAGENARPPIVGSAFAALDVTTAARPGLGVAGGRIHGE